METLHSLTENIAKQQCLNFIVYLQTCKLAGSKSVYNYYYYYYYQLQLGCHPMAVVILHVYKI